MSGAQSPVDSKDQEREFTRTQFATIANQIKRYLMNQGIDQLQAGIFAANLTKEIERPVLTHFTSNEKIRAAINSAYPTTAPSNLNEDQRALWERGLKAYKVGLRKDLGLDEPESKS